MPSSSASPARSERDEWLATVTGATDEWLVELLEARPDLLLTGPANVGQLAELLISPRHVLQWYETSDRTTRQVLEALCVLPESTDLRTLAGLLGTESDLVQPLVDRLVSSGLVLHRAERLMPNPGLPVAIPHPAGLGSSVRGQLAAQSTQVVKELAGRIGVGTKGTKATLVEAIAGALSSPEQVGALVAAGPEGTRELARRMADGYVELNVRSGIYQASQSDRGPEGWLLRRALLTSTSWSAATMPAEVALALRGGRLFDSFVATGPVLKTVPADAGHVDRQAGETALTLVADVAALLDAWSLEPAKLLQAGGLGLREVRRAAKLIDRPEPDTARLIELVAGIGLADVDDDVVVPTVEYDQWLDLPVGVRWGRLTEAWLSAPIHLSVAGSMDAKDKPIPPLLNRLPESGALARRMVFLNVLVDVPAGHAVDRAGLADRVDWQQPVLWQGGPARPEQLVSWIWDEAELFGLVAGGALSSFGRSMADGQPEQATEALGALAPPLTTQVVLQADLTAMVAGELAPDLRRELDLLAEVESTGAATVYRFSEASLRRGFDAGRTSNEILTFLSDHAPKGVPQPLAYLVVDLERRYGQVRVGPAGCYVRSDDPALVAEVVRAKKTGRLDLRLLAPTVAVSREDPAMVERTLRDAGYLAAVEDAEGTLVLRRPPARRAPAEGDWLDDPDDFDEDDMLTELLSNPGLLAAMTGLPTGVAGPDLVENMRRLLADREDGEGVGPGTIDLAAVVQQLRNPPPRPVVPARRPEPLRALQSGENLLAAIGLLDDKPRPTRIATDTTAISDLLDRAWDEEWLVRLSYFDGNGKESEFYAWVVEGDGSTIEVLVLPNETSRQLKLQRIRWLRVATETEEEAQLP